MFTVSRQAIAESRWQIAPQNCVAVHCRELTKSYGTGDARVLAPRGINLDVRRGELLMVAGPSGCGKTTLIAIIAAILEQIPVDARWEREQDRRPN